MRWLLSLWLVLAGADARATPGQMELATDAVVIEAPAPPAQRRRRRRRRPLPVPEGRAISDLSRARCEAILVSHGVSFESLDAEAVPGVEQPLRLEGPVAGVTVQHRSHGRGNRRRRRRIRRLSILDCRMVVAVLAWAPTLRGAGVSRLEHYSVYRPGAQVGGNGRPSGHASALAIDLGEIVLDDDRRLVIEEAWKDRRRGVSPCPARSDDDDDQRLLRDLVCAAYDAELFQVVLTPHHDEHHENHVHLELRPGVTWSLLE